MHELSIAMELVDGACQQARLLGNPRVEALHVRVGPLSGVEPDSLSSAFIEASKGTAMEGVRLVIEETPLVAHCETCGKTREIPGIQYLRCPVCDTPVTELAGGEELELYALEVEEDDE